MKNILLLTSLMLVSVWASAQKSKTANVDKNSIAVKGYDVVCYFDGLAMEGYEKIHSEFMGVTYLFTSITNKETFDKNPAKFIPQYGGWCAYAMGVDGSKVKINPESFKIVDDKLLLFYKTRKVNTLNLWNENEVPLKEKANEFWAKNR